MQNTFPSKLGLYDFLVILVPGLSLGYMISLCDYIANILDSCIYSEFFDDDIVRTTAFVIFSYLLGLLNHSVQNRLWPVLHNYKAHISYVEGKNREHCCIDSWVNCPCLILRGLSLFLMNICLILKEICPNHSQEEDIDYLKMYYHAEKRPRSSIGYLEYQVAFIRNMLPALIIFCTNVGENLWLLIVALYFLMIERQEKIYKAVIEDFKYN